MNTDLIHALCIGYLNHGTKSQKRMAKEMLMVINDTETSEKEDFSTPINYKVAGIKIPLISKNTKNLISRTNEMAAYRDAYVMEYQRKAHEFFLDVCLGTSPKIHDKRKKSKRRQWTHGRKSRTIYGTGNGERYPRHIYAGPRRLLWVGDSCRRMMIWPIVLLLHPSDVFPWEHSKLKS